MSEMELVSVLAVHEVPDLAAASLEELASRAVSEHEQIERTIARIVRVVEEGLSIGLRHAISAGEALLEAQTRVEPGLWTDWVHQHVTFDYTTCVKYMRFARYKDQLIAAGNVSTATAMTVLRGMPALVAPYEASRRFSPEVRDEARRMHAQGATHTEIIDLLGISGTTVRRYVDPEYDRKNREASRRAKARRVAARRALKKAEEAAAAKKVGGSIAEAYALVRRCAGELDSALAVVGPPLRSSLRSALQEIHQAEDLIVQALKLSRTDGGDR